MPRKFIKIQLLNWKLFLHQQALKMVCNHSKQNLLPTVGPACICTQNLYLTSACICNTCVGVCSHQVQHAVSIAHCPSQTCPTSPPPPPSSALSFTPYYPLPLPPPLPPHSPRTLPSHPCPIPVWGGTLTWFLLFPENLPSISLKSWLQGLGYRV
jgi:hypothetical protein